MIDSVVSKALLSEIDEIVDTMRYELKELGLADKTFTREQIDPAKADVSDLCVARDWFAALFENEFRMLCEIRARHDRQTWENMKTFRVKGLEEQRVLRTRQEAFKKAFLTGKPAFMFKTKAGTDGLKRGAK